METLELVLNRELVAQQVFEALQDAIVAKQLPPGSPVSETGLAKLLGVSKTPVREAVLRLRQISLLEGQGRSLRVVTPSVTTIRQAYELRVALETQAAWCTAERATADQADELAVIAQEGLSACLNGITVDFRRADLTFHRKVAEYSLNPMLAQHTFDAITLVNTLRSRDAAAAPISESCAEQHVAIAEAIRNHKPEEAASIIRAHVNAAAQRVLKEFDGENSHDTRRTRTQRIKTRG